MKNHKIIIYTLPTCGFCQTLKEYLSTQNIPFMEINVEKDAEAAAEMVTKTGQYGVPVIDIDGKLVVGYQKSTIDALLGL